MNTVECGRELVALQRLKQWDRKSGIELVYVVRPWRERDTGRREEKRDLYMLERL